MGAQWARISELIVDAGSMGPIRFEKTHPDAVLIPETVKAGELEGGDVGQGTMVIRTGASGRTTKIMSPRVMLVRKDRSPDAHDEPWIEVGRSPDADVLVNDYTVSSRHARVLRPAARKGWVIEDLGSKNGTLLNGKGIPPYMAVPLVNETTVQFGRVVLIFLDPHGLYRHLRPPDAQWFQEGADPDEEEG